MAAILNGAFREVILVPATGTGMALLLNGALLTLLAFLASLASIKIIRPSSELACLYVGLLWVSQTLLFELLFGLFVAGKTWQELAQIFYLFEGNMFVVVLIATAVSPWIAAKIRGLVQIHTLLPATTAVQIY